MNKPTRIAALAAVLLAGGGAAFGQQIEWTQTFNMPRGHNLPKGVVAELLGIELGEPYATVKPKAEALLRAATNTDEQYKKFTVIEQRFRLPSVGTPIEVSFPGALQLAIRRYNPATPPFETDLIEIRFSAPSSGHQVVGVKRSIIYDKHEHQIRVGPLLSAIKAKFKSEPQVFRLSDNVTEYLFQYNDGRPFARAGNRRTCREAAFENGLDPFKVSRINEDGTCDVLLLVEVRTGISPDHAERVNFELSDNERTKQNFTADFAFFDSYIRKYQQRPGGVAPKL